MALFCHGAFGVWGDGLRAARLWEQGRVSADDERGPARAKQVDKEGRAINAATDVFNADLAGCTRVALRAMEVPPDLLRTWLPEPPAQGNEQTNDARGLVGNPGVVVVTIVHADLIIEAGGVTIIFAMSLELTKEVAEALRRRPRPGDPLSCQDHLNLCLGTDTADKDGDVIGSSRCKMCFEWCKGEGKGMWPKGIELTDESWASCLYPNIKWYH